MGLGGILTGRALCATARIVLRDLMLNEGAGRWGIMRRGAPPFRAAQPPYNCGAGSRAMQTDMARNRDCRRAARAGHGDKR